MQSFNRFQFNQYLNGTFLSSREEFLKILPIESWNAVKQNFELGLGTEDVDINRLCP